jgi:magnesium-transporting ATPase (P-type)
MKKLASITFYTGLIISAIIGFLHFFAPYAFGWYSYIPDAPKEIFAAIDYVNFFISLLLFGLSAILLFLKKRMFAGSGEIFIFYVFLVFTWFCRIIITLVIPWPSSLQTWLLVGFSTEFILTLVPAVYLLWSKTIQFQKPKIKT